MNSIMAKIPLNWELLKNPVNWIIVFLMLALAGVGLALVARSTNDNTTSNGDAS